MKNRIFVSLLGLLCLASTSSFAASEDLIQESTVVHTNNQHSEEDPDKVEKTLDLLKQAIKGYSPSKEEMGDFHIYQNALRKALMEQILKNNIVTLSKLFREQVKENSWHPERAFIVAFLSQYETTFAFARNVAEQAAHQAIKDFFYDKNLFKAWEEKQPRYWSPKDAYKSANVKVCKYADRSTWKIFRRLPLHEYDNYDEGFVNKVQSALLNILKNSPSMKPAYFGEHAYWLSELITLCLLSQNKTNYLETLFKTKCDLFFEKDSLYRILFELGYLKSQHTDNTFAAHLRSTLKLTHDLVSKENQSYEDQFDKDLMLLSTNFLAALGILATLFFGP